MRLSDVATGVEEEAFGVLSTIVDVDEAEFVGSGAWDGPGVDGDWREAVDCWEEARSSSEVSCGIDCSRTAGAGIDSIVLAMAAVEVASAMRTQENRETDQLPRQARRSRPPF